MSLRQCVTSPSAQPVARLADANIQCRRGLTFFNNTWESRCQSSGSVCHSPVNIRHSTCSQAERERLDRDWFVSPIHAAVCEEMCSYCSRPRQHYFSAFMVLLNGKDEMQNNNDDTFPGSIMECWGRDSASRQKLLQCNAIFASAFFFSHISLQINLFRGILSTNHDHLPLKTRSPPNFSHCTAVDWGEELHKQKASSMNMISWKGSSTTTVTEQVFLEISQKDSAGSFSSACWPHHLLPPAPIGTPSVVATSLGQ